MWPTMKVYLWTLRRNKWPKNTQWNHRMSNKNHDGTDGFNTWNFWHLFTCLRLLCLFSLFLSKTNTQKKRKCYFDVFNTLRSIIACLKHEIMCTSVLVKASKLLAPLLNQFSWSLYFIDFPQEHYWRCFQSINYRKCRFDTDKNMRRTWR